MRACPRPRPQLRANSVKPLPQRERGFTPRLVVATGEPAGVGPDVCLLSAAAADAELLFVGDPDVLRQRARQIGIRADIETVADPARPRSPRPRGRTAVLPVACAAPVTAGEADVKNAPYVIRVLEVAAELALCGDYDGLVTAPAHKGVINDAGIAFSGHTEWLARRTGAGRAVMLLTAGRMRVALATTHLPLRAVPGAITGALLREVIAILHGEMRAKFHINRPRIHVCGLNPHAGEGGHLGREEIDTIIPAIQDLRRQGLDLTGPLPADTVFVPDSLRRADVVLAMYHDQGLPTLKSRNFDKAVNITLGLPIIRTSPDHGTALEIAGSGRAKPDSMQSAIAAAAQLAVNMAGAGAKSGRRETKVKT